MIKLSPPSNSAFHSFKCGEIFCISPAVYNVTCCLCPVKMHLDEFPRHCEMEHLALVEESINLEALESKRTEILTNDADISVKNEVDLEDDPIKHEDLTGYSDKEYKGLNQLLEKTPANHKLENMHSNLSKEPKVKVIANMVEKSEVENLTKKPKTRNSKKRKVKSCDIKELKDPEKHALFELKSDDLKENKTENEFDSNNEDLGNYEDEMDGDWLEEEETSKTESEAGNDSIKDELPYPCHICKRSFRSKNGLKKHNQIIHNPNKKPPKKDKEIKVVHKCDECNQVFRIARDLRGHRWKHTGIFCDICGKRFTQPSNMLRHKQRHTGIKDHKCEECGKAFFTDKELKSHIICHTGLMPVICEICGKQCRHRGVLTAHMRRHTGERPAKCEVCGKCFFSIHDLNVHAVAHTSERPFECDICSSTFQRRKALRVHKLIHSKDRKHVCKICGKGFAQSGGLKSHMRTHNAALENLAIEYGQQPLVSNILGNPTSQAGDYSNELTTSTSKTTTTPVIVISPENSMVEQYIN